MIYCFSGRCAGNYHPIKYRPEHFIGTSMMMSYRYARKEDLKRLINLFKLRKKRSVKNES